MKRAFILAIVLAAVSAGCTSFTPTEPATPDGGATEAGPGDAGAPPAGVGAIALSNAGFERAGCADWSASDVSFADDSTAHSGAISCRVCRKGSVATSWAITQETGQGVSAPGSHFYAEAWVRAPADGTRAAQGVRILIYSIDDNDQYHTVENGGGSDLPAVDATWRKVTGTFSPTIAGASSLSIGINAQDGEDGCFLVDDVVLRRDP
jgi:hypothetical protein